MKTANFKKIIGRAVAAACVGLFVAFAFQNCSPSSSDPAAPVVADTDSDGIADTADNCPGVSNVLQSDLDQDGVGNECDSKYPAEIVGLIWD